MGRKKIMRSAHVVIAFAIIATCTALVPPTLLAIGQCSENSDWYTCGDPDQMEDSFFGAASGHCLAGEEFWNFLAGGDFSCERLREAFTSECPQEDINSFLCFNSCLLDNGDPDAYFDYECLVNANDIYPDFDAVQCGTGTSAHSDSACHHCDAHNADDGRCDSCDCHWADGMCTDGAAADLMCDKDGFIAKDSSFHKWRR